MIEAVVTEHVNAPADRVRELYRDADNWARIFPATIRSARVVRREGDTTVVEVDHVEGKVVNILRDVSRTRTDLVEFKRRYDATFVNAFIPEGEGMRYTLRASVQNACGVGVAQREQYIGQRGVASPRLRVRGSIQPSFQALYRPFPWCGSAEPGVKV